ncbi:hypothetical protein DVJ78_06585 [Humibacter sp. BT305]|nr:hypothetical protein DVJ78_06585 [Humibacter sp. BT305]
MRRTAERAGVATLLFCAAFAAVLGLGAGVGFGLAAAPAAASSPPTSAGPTDGTVLVRGSDGSVPLELTGTVEPGDVIHVSLTWPDGTVDLCDVFAASDGSWACDDLPALPDLVGTLELWVDGGGVFATSAIGVISPPTILSDADDAATLTIDALAPWVSGSGTPGATVVVEVSDGDGCTTAVDASGAWACSLTAGTSSASRTVRAGQSWALDPATIAWGAPVVLVDGASTVVGAPGDPGAPGSPGSPDSGSETGAGPGSGAGAGSGAAGSGGGGEGGSAASDGAGGAAGTGGAGGPGSSGEGAVSASGAAGQEGATSTGRSESGDAHPGGAASTGSSPSGASPGITVTTSGDGIAGGGDAESATQADASVPESAESALSPASERPTTFGSSLRSPAALLDAGSPALVFTGAVTLGLVLLVMVPAGMLESTLEANSERVRRSAALRWLNRFPRVPRLSSRGRSGTVVSVALVVGATAALGAFVAPDAGAEGGFLRLAGAFAVGSLVVNGLALALMAAVARASGSRLEVTANGHSILVTALTVLLSRAALLQPGFVFGVAISAGAADGRTRTSARVAAAGVVGLLVAGLGAWFAHAALLDAMGDGSPAGGWGSFGVDVLTAMTVEALTGAVVAMIPLRFFSGAELWRGARAGWVALAALTAAAAMVALAPLPEAWNAVGGDTTRWLAAFAAVTALTAGVWCWFRFVPERSPSPTPRRRSPHASPGGRRPAL